MNRASPYVAAAALFFFAASALAQSVAPLDVREVMQRKVNPAMLGIWNIGNNAMNDAGGLDPALLDEDRWDTLAASADNLTVAGREMAAASRFISASPANEAVSEGEVTMASVQARLDADPAGFRRQAAAFAEHAEKIAVAARAHDVTATGTLIGEMDAICESCHAEYWYGD